MKKTILVLVLFVVAALVASFFLEAAVVWALCWALHAVGIASVGGFTVAFSWPLVLAVWLISVLLSSVYIE